MPIMSQCSGNFTFMHSVRVTYKINHASRFARGLESTERNRSRAVDLNTDRAMFRARRTRISYRRIVIGLQRPRVNRALSHYDHGGEVGAVPFVSLRYSPARSRVLCRLIIRQLPGRAVWTTLDQRVLISIGSDSRARRLARCQRRNEKNIRVLRARNKIGGDPTHER